MIALIILKLTLSLILMLLIECAAVVWWGN